MATKEMTTMVKILGLVGAIFVLIAQFVPWGTGAYLFGADFGAFGGFNAFYTQFFSSGIWQFILVAVIMILLFFINLITLILGFLTFRKIESRGINAYLKLSILVTLEFIIYIVGWSVAAGGVPGAGIVSIGFIMILLAMIMYWVTFGLGKALGIYTTTAMYQPQPPSYQQPQQQMTYAHQPPVQQAPTPPAQPQAQPQPKQQIQPPAQKTTKAKASVPKFCSQCGGPLQPNAKFCPGCGNKL